MSKVNNGFLGFIVGGGLAFLGVVVALGGIGAEDVRQYLLLFLGLPVGLFGGVIGAAIGALVDQGEQGKDGFHVSPNSCRRCGSRLRGDPKTCKWCGLEEPLRR